MFVVHLVGESLDDLSPLVLTDEDFAFDFQSCFSVLTVLLKVELVECDFDWDRAPTTK